MLVDVDETRWRDKSKESSRNLMQSRESGLPILVEIEPDDGR